jgi:hypothetical protein
VWCCSQLKITRLKERYQDSEAGRAIVQLMRDTLLKLQADMKDIQVSPSQSTTSLALAMAMDTSSSASSSPSQLRVAQRVDLNRRMREPKFHLLMSILHDKSLRDGIRIKEAMELLLAIDRAFDQLVTEKLPECRELLEVQLRQCLLTATLLVLRSPTPLGYEPRTAEERDPWNRRLMAIFRYTAASVTMLETITLEDSTERVAQSMRSDAFEKLLRTGLAILDQLFPPKSPVDPCALQESPEEYEGRDSRDHARLALEEGLVEGMSRDRVVPCILGHFAAASKLAAAEFRALHNYAAPPKAPAPGQPSQAPNHKLRRALKRMSSILTFFMSVACKSERFCRELLSQHVLIFLVNDPTLGEIAGVIGSDMPRELLHFRGYRADKTESEFYGFWNAAARLVSILVHRVTRPHLGYDAVLTLPPEKRDEFVTFDTPIEEEEAAVVDHAVFFVQHFHRLICFPLSEDRILTFRLLEEAESVMVLLRELGVHGYSWQSTDPTGYEAVRETVKVMILRTSLLLDNISSLLLSFRDLFSTVSQREIMLKERWLVGREKKNGGGGGAESKPTPTPAPGELAFEQIIESAIVRILASAVAFICYTGPQRLPPMTPVTPEESARLSLAEGTRVRYMSRRSECCEGKGLCMILMPSLERDLQ